MHEFEVLSWLCNRQAFFKFLEPSMVSADRSSGNDDFSLSHEEGNILKQLMADKKAAALFWAIAWSELQVHSWGFSVYDWTHRCSCHTTAENKELKTPCKWNGRRLTEIANGKFQEFHHNLLCLRLDSTGPRAALQALSEIDSEQVAYVEQAFETAKQRLR